MALVQRSLIEVWAGPQISGDFVWRSCIENFDRDLVKRSCSVVEGSCQEISHRGLTRRPKDIRRSCTGTSHRGFANKSTNGFCTSAYGRCFDIDIASVFRRALGKRSGDLWVLFFVVCFVLIGSGSYYRILAGAYSIVGLQVGFLARSSHFLVSFLYSCCDLARSPLDHPEA